MGFLRSAVIVLVALALNGCREKSCIDGNCELPCEAIALTCTEQPVFFVGDAADAPPNLQLREGNAAARDTLISNGRVTAVISALDAPNDLAPTGGNLIDFGVAGGLDDVTLTYQIAGILPDDAFAYTSVERGAQSVTLRGTLDGRPEVKVVTHYEIRACDPGLRVHTELFNGSADTQAFVVADAMHWGKRRQVPFAPAKGQGYVQPKLDLLELSALWKPYDFGAAATPAPDRPSYGVVACDREQLSGVNDLEISALGTPMTYVEPGDSIVLERMLVVGDNGGVAPAVDAVLEARTQLFGGSLQTVSGHITGVRGGDSRRASIVVSVDGRPVTSIVPRDDGAYSARVPAGRVTLEAWSFGRKVAETTGGDIAIPEPATVQLSLLRDGFADWGLVIFTGGETGTFHERLDKCTPWLGPPNGASPACNQVIVPPQGTELEVPAGHYVVYGTAGPEHTLVKQEVDLVGGELQAIELDVHALPLVPAGWLSADLHVHGRASFDSGIPDDDRVKTFVASGVDVIAATDHDVIGDYTKTVASLGLEDRVAVMGGLEATQLIPWLDVPGEDVPRVIGHFNFWPLVQMPGEPRAGAPWDELIEPGQLFDRMAPLVGDGGMMMLNHPWGDPLFGRDIGYLRAIKFDPRVRVDDQPMVVKRPGGLHRNMDWNIIEIINGSDMSELMQSRVLWFSLLAQGFITPGAGNSDSHGMTDGQLGWARNWVQTSTTVGNFSAAQFDADLREGKLVAGNGIVVLVELAGHGAGFTPIHPAAGDKLKITVKAPPWIPVEEVRLVTSKGTQIIAQDLPQPDPFGTETTRFTGEVALALAADDFVIAEAGMHYPLAADLDNDGVPDTTDNNGDGFVDTDDVDPDEDVGPLVAPPDPTDPADPRYLITRVTPGAWPEGFANPLLVDVDGNGWTPPGL
jgi:hypothetical protein